MKKNHLSDLFTKIKNGSQKNPETIEKLEAVVFHARSRVMNKQNFVQNCIGAYICIMLGALLGVIWNILHLFIFAYFETAKFLIVSLLTFFIFVFLQSRIIFDANNILEICVISYLFLYIVFNFKSFAESLRGILINLLDAILLGQVTAAYFKFVVRAGRSGCELMVRQPKPYQIDRLATFFYVSRQPLRSCPKLEEIEKFFLNMCGSRDYDDFTIEENCKRYWDEFEVNENKSLF